MRIKAKLQGGNVYEFFDLDTLRSVVIDNLGNTDMVPVSLGVKSKAFYQNMKQTAQQSKDKATEAIAIANLYLDAITAEE